MNKEYLMTHPWITFRIDLGKAPTLLWVLAGEAQSKCEHIAGVPLQPPVAEELHQIYLAKGVHGTTAIEGNSLTEDEVRQHLRGELKLSQSKEYLKTEIDNILTCCNQIRKALIRGQKAKITVESLRKFNTQILNGLELEKGVFPGRIRDYNVTVGPYKGAPFADCEFLLEKLCEWIEGPDFKNEGENRIITAFVKAIVFHVYLAWIHPFGDGNGRTARLIELQILLSEGVSTPAAHLLSNHYNLTRKRYYAELDKASKSGGDIIPFIQYATQGFVEGLREQFEFIREQQWDISWSDYVNEQFGDCKSPTELRQRRLVLDLSHAGDVVTPINQIPEISVTLAKLYAKKTIRTMQRDVSALERMGLLERRPDGVRAKREKILAFLPGHAGAAIPPPPQTNGSQDSPELPLF
jgi:Fic family protein